MDEERSRAARAAAERALIRVVHHYGARPEFVLLGGLVPDLLCAASEFRHAGTTDVDVQVDLEIAYGSVNARRLERALRNAEFEPDGDRVWRWVADGPGQAIIKFELLADLQEHPGGTTVRFDGCERLGAANLPGTGFASRDVEDLLANFATPDAQGPRAYVAQMLLDYPSLDEVTVAADAVVVVDAFHAALFPRRSGPA